MHFGSKNPNNNTSTGIAPLDEFIERLEQEFKSAKEQNTRMNESGAGMRNDNNNTGIGNEKACVDEENVKRLFEEFTTGKKNNKSFHLKDLMKYCYFDSETPYTRNLIYENEHFSLMLLVWNTNAKSCIHSHGGSQCWLTVLHGQIRESIYPINPNDPSFLKIDEDSVPIVYRYANVNDTRYIDDSKGFHRIENMGDMAVSLHCYAPPYQRCKCYDPTGKQIIGTMNFDTEWGIVKSKSKTLKSYPL
jgi:cysteine dioxygenase